MAQDSPAGGRSGTQVFPALLFLALLLAHVPDAHERLIRTYGAYSVHRRARWRQDCVLTDTRPLSENSREADGTLPDWPALCALRQRWAELLERILEVDPLACPRCGGRMRIISFLLDEDVMHTILRNLRSKGRDPRALPEHASSGREPP